MKIAGTPWEPDDRVGGPLDEVLVGVRAAVSDLSIRRLAVTHASEDDNVWFIERKSDGFEVQIDTGSDGCPPFSLESDRRGQRADVKEVRAAIDTIVEWIRPV